MPSTAVSPAPTISATVVSTASPTAPTASAAAVASPSTSHRDLRGGYSVPTINQPARSAKMHAVASY